jgi:hypothetical protein
MTRGGTSPTDYIRSSVLETHLSPPRYARGRERRVGYYIYIYIIIVVGGYYNDDDDVGTHTECVNERWRKVTRICSDVEVEEKKE